MLINENEEVELNVDDLFNDNTDEQEPSDADKKDEQEVVKNEEDMTKAVSERINTVRRKTEIETQDKIAKELGFENYAELQKENEKKLLRDAGLDENDKSISDTVEKLVNKRIAEDPRFKKLEELEAKTKADFVESQIKEINSFAGTNFTSIEQFSKDTLALWEKIGNLKQAYLATQGEAIIAKNKNVQSQGTLKHLASPSANGGVSTKRALTDEEKAIWRSVFPDITDEELSKKTMEIESQK